MSTAQFGASRRWRLGRIDKTVAGRWCGQGAASTRLPCTPEDIPIGVRWLCLVKAVIPKNHLEDVGVVGVLRVVEVGEPHPCARALVDGTGLPDGAKLAQELVAKYDAPVAILVHGDGGAVGGGALGSRRWALLVRRGGSHSFARWVEVTRTPLELCCGVSSAKSLCRPLNCLPCLEPSQAGRRRARCPGCGCSGWARRLPDAAPKVAAVPPPRSQGPRRPRPLPPFDHRFQRHAKLSSKPTLRPWTRMVMVT